MGLLMRECFVAWSRVANYEMDANFVSYACHYV